MGSGGSTSSWRACPKVDSRNNFPIVEGAYTPTNSAFIPPLRTPSMSSMQSAPAHIPATTVASFGAGFADPDLSLVCAEMDLFTEQSPQPGSVRPTSLPAPARAPSCPSRLGGFIPAACVQWRSSL